MARPISILELTSEEAQELKRRVQATTTSQRDHLRAQIVLLRAHGMKQHDVAETLGVSIVCVNKWSQRFERHGLSRLQDQPRRGRQRTISLEKIEQVITQAGQAPPGRRRWTGRRPTERVGKPWRS